MELKDIINETIGLDSENNAKAYVSLAYKVLRISNNEVITKMEHASERAQVNIEAIPCATNILISFSTPGDSDMRIFWHAIQLCQDAAAAELSEDEFHFIAVTIVPKKFNGSHYICATSPLLYSVQAPAPNEKANVISLIFDDEDIEFFETDEIDIDEIDGEVEREFAETQRLELMAEEKRLEKEASEARRNRLIQERRKY